MQTQQPKFRFVEADSEKQTSMHEKFHVIGTGMLLFKHTTLWKSPT